MTYSEVRERYTCDMAMVIEARENQKRAAREALSMIFSWFLPWSVAILTIIFASTMLNAQKTFVASALFSVSFLMRKKTQTEEGTIRLLSIALSWLVAAATLLTVLPAWM